MRLSLYEIETTLRKASIGAGFPTGLAEDIGRAAVWLVARDMDGVAAVLAAIASGFQVPQMQVGDDGVITFAHARAAICGPSVAELLVGEPTCAQVRLTGIDTIPLLLGITGLAAARFECAFRFEFSNGAFANVSADRVTMGGQAPEPGCDIIITRLTGQPDKPALSLPKSGCEVRDTDWHRAEALAAKTYVPESRDSRVQGAGAGLTDND